ncbi:ATP-binding cassette domain-containing protein [Flexivirga caeni]|uniref:Sugar ABC transporter ATP-binding protein n=1 Tax=Flexivirga caeni TaxID=2294115 RepID=A0A3M9MFB2_9MICO|nr:ATP-binding cassette domain-containing protein [Flexivirga caeni]RNI24241.1 sugar ABC transporter ATP-binding protein [Flexivirga caeni]
MSETQARDARQNILELNDIAKSFGAIRSLKGVSLEVGKGEVIGLVGDNGAGKSTLTKVIAGAVLPDSGSTRVDGELVDFRSPGDARVAGIETVYQDLALCNDLDVPSNLFLGREPTRGPLGRIDRSKLRRETERHLKELGVKVPSLDEPVGSLSGGQRQVVAIARAITFEPRLLLLDEPTAALAVREVNMVLKLIKDVAANGVGVILVTHRLQDLLLVCDRIVVMYEGSVRRVITAAEATLEKIASAITED